MCGSLLVPKLLAEEHKVTVYDIMYLVLLSLTP